MVKRNPEVLLKYLNMITKKKGGPEEALNKAMGARAGMGLESMAPKAPKLARSGMEALERGRDAKPEEIFGLEAIINADLRPAVDVVDGTFSIDHPLWVQLAQDPFKSRITAAIPSIGRIELPGSGIPYGGTGFVVGDGLVMTNRHVAEIFAAGLGDRNIRFIDGAKAGIDFLREQGRPTGPMLEVKRVVMIHPYWDMALLAVDGLPPARGPLRLSLADPRDLVGHDIFIIGYPAFDRRNPTDVQNNVMAGRFGIKRLQPGELQGGLNTGSFGKTVMAATHDCSTLGGNSGSAVIDLATGEVLGLHFGGRYAEQNYAVPASELGRDDRVIQAGVNFAGTPPGGASAWTAWWTRADATEAPQRGGGAGAPAAVPSPALVSTGDGSVTIEIPLRINVSLGQAAGAKHAEAVETLGEDSLEALREPFRDTDFTTRNGYDAGFIDGLTVPMPNAAGPGVLAKTLDGGDILHYENFSVRMHAKRRLALLTGSNVTKEPALKKPEPGKDYTRKGLSGLGENDQEKWFADPRLDGKFQLPDVFFTKDRKAFDKGHVVRRDDVAWGRTYDILRRANGDTYHVTNCSPQVAGFNRSADGENNWGDLENHVLSEAVSERLCVFAGPVLAEGDEVFTGRGDGGTVIKAKIPQSYWKVIVARADDGLAAYGFVLEQELGAVDFEFTVPEEFQKKMTPIADIEAMAGVVFDPVIRVSDQFDTDRGAEIALRAGARRKGREG